MPTRLERPTTTASASRKVDAERLGGHFEKDHAARWRARHERALRIAARKQPGIERVQAIDILPR